LVSFGQNSPTHHHTVSELCIGAAAIAFARSFLLTVDDSFAGSTASPLNLASRSIHFSVIVDSPLSGSG